MKCMINMKSVVALVFCLTLTILAGVGTSKAADTEKAAKAPVIIQTVQMRGEGTAYELVVSASVPATYTSYKTTDPQRFVIDFSQALPADSLATVHVNKGPVKDITVKSFETDAGALTRMEIFLDQDIEPRITPSVDKHGELLVTFPGYKPKDLSQVVHEESTSKVPVQGPVTDPKSTIAPVSKPFESGIKQHDLAETTHVSTDLLVTNITATAGVVEIITSSPVSDFKTFRLNKPERVIIDIPNAKIGVADKLIQLNTSGVSTARIGSYPDKVRVVFDAMNGTLPDATIVKTSSGLQVKFAAPSAGTTVAETQTSSINKSEKSAKNSVEKTPVKPEVLQVSAIDFQVLDGISRVTIRTNGSAAVEAPVKVTGGVSFRVKNAQLPHNLQRSLETSGFLSPVLRITPVQVKTKSGSDVLIRVALKSEQPFTVHTQADVITLDIKHSAEMLKNKSTQVGQAMAAPNPVAAKKPALSHDDQMSRVVDEVPLVSKRTYTGRKVTLEFADAEVRKIFQLLSEVSNKNFVLGDEVGGTISLKLVNVPWDQALDVILNTKGLDKREEGNIVLIRGKNKFKSAQDEEEALQKAALNAEPLETAIFDVNYSDLSSIESQFNVLKLHKNAKITKDSRTNKIIVKDVKPAIDDMRKLLKELDVPEKQVMIEARIIEASSDFSRSLGVSWGLNTTKPALTSYNSIINDVSSVFGGLATTPGTSAVGSTTGAADITFGTIGANVRLSMRLNAAAKVGLIKFISSPKVATLNNKSAKILSGKQIPYISATSDKIETKFVEAALSLEITPHINNNGTIVLKIDAKNDSVDTTSTSTTSPPINKKQATTEMLLKDGETTVIGGIFVDSETQGEEGMPWLMDVPLLGNLFKSTSYSKSKSELLIFITPRILTAQI